MEAEGLVSIQEKLNGDVLSAAKFAAACCCLAAASVTFLYLEVWEEVSVVLEAAGLTDEACRMEHLLAHPASWCLAVWDCRRCYSLSFREVTSSE